MGFFIWLGIHCILFIGSYFALAWRRHKLELEYDWNETDPTLWVSAIVPLFGIVWGLCDVAIKALGWRE